MIHLEKNGIAYLSASRDLAPNLPTIIFIHGSGQRGMFWEEQIHGLSDIANVIAIDLPGHGESTIKGVDSVEGYGEVVLGFINSLDLPHPVPAGLSIGGAIVQYLLVNHQEYFKAGILINTGARLKVSPTITDMIRDNYDEYLKMLISLGLAEENRRNKSLCEKVLACSSAGPETTAGDFQACNGFDTMETIHRILAPVLVLSADKDILTPVKYGAWLVDNIKSAKHIIIENAGHMSSMEQPDQVNDAIKNFICNLK